MAQAEAMASNPDAMAMMMRMQANPRVMEAVMDIAMNGEAAAAKYENDEESAGDDAGNGEAQRPVPQE